MQPLKLNVTPIGIDPCEFLLALLYSSYVGNIKGLNPFYDLRKGETYESLKLKSLCFGVYV